MAITIATKSTFRVYIKLIIDASPCRRKSGGKGTRSNYTYTIIIMPIIIIIIHAYSYGIPLDCHGSYDMVHYHLACIWAITSSDMCIVCVRMCVHIIHTYMCIHFVW